LFLARFSQEKVILITFCKETSCLKKRSFNVLWGNHGGTKKENKVEIESRKVNKYVHKSRRERRRGKGS
jgi:hypothetical protein